MAGGKYNQTGNSINCIKKSETEWNAKYMSLFILSKVPTNDYKIIGKDDKLQTVRRLYH